MKRDLLQHAGWPKSRLLHRNLFLISEHEEFLRPNKSRGLLTALQQLK